ncbi:MAG: SDR family NAD(P)-dependent oxidoreductase [Deltaproteobacteria bacterium]|nr:SDR family NAD(P)-dependent oxidoreductase [Deltaproteobacteria bacterium]MBW2362243.1 SDR family NAD(P)-dependent oxidoreductase [Deltaproteobacteria bacterium]
MTDWSDRVAVITGAASGIGAGLAGACAERGMHVVAADVDRASLESVGSRIEGGAASVRTVVTDVSSAEAVDALAAEAFSLRGAVNLLFNNAGVLVDGKSWERPVESWRWSIDVNLMGVVHGIRSFVPRMLEQDEAGRVVNTASVGGLVGGGTFMGPYQATKHAVVALSEVLFAELALEPAPITASVLCPGDVATGIWESDRLRPTEQRNELGSRAEAAFHDLVAGNVAQGLDPAEFASRVFEGIEADKFWILPQPGFKPMYEIRAKGVLEETNPPSTSEMLEFTTR